ncbi:MAG: hybrid sensor histidine kinase/response regulator [Oceanipulchritudo sp.]
MPTATILVVDDQLLNVRLLERALLRSDMTVHSATNGPEGLRLAREVKPDVILLDIVMPGMDGIEVCRQLKEDQGTREIPVIFISARTDKEDKLAGFDVGAADYLIKPFEMEETLARVQTQLRIIKEHRENLALTRQLEQSRRQSALMHLTEGIAHNLNNLLGVIMGYISLIRSNTGKPEKITRNCDRMEAAVQRMTRIVHQLTVIGHFKSLQKEMVPLRKILTGAVARFHRATSTDCPVDEKIALPDDFQFRTNRELLEVCLERLLQNAFESYQPGENGASPAKGEVRLEVSMEEGDGSGELVLEVLDRGRGIDPEIKDSVFEPFVTSSSTIGRGMGLTIAQHSVNCLGGIIDLSDREGGGTTATVRLPVETDSDSAKGMEGS